MNKKVPKKVIDLGIEEEVEIITLPLYIDGELFEFTKPRTKLGVDSLTILIKQDVKEVLYWVIWRDRRILKVYSGTVGEVGRKNEILLSLSSEVKETLNKIVKEKINEGFRYIEEDDLTTLIVKKCNKKDDDKIALKKQTYLKNVIDGILFWTGNGYCDGGEIGMEVSQIFNYVIDVEKAVQEIIEELENENLLEGVEISYFNSVKDEYITVYPI
ncbi:hypothetical protein [Bacillus sp. X1(2014)]|uniref:hypothetical protein n=1 Tax=Bacillus sp. X1(2014) TaxID=1565991 RepID=UPI00119D576F|nr:hypothetical protein [Bacillus sp. X1(2014)]